MGLSFLRVERLRELNFRLRSRLAEVIDWRGLSMATASSSGFTSLFVFVSQQSDQYSSVHEIQF